MGWTLAKPEIDLLARGARGLAGGDIALDHLGVDGAGQDRR